MRLGSVLRKENKAHCPRPHTTLFPPSSSIAVRTLLRENHAVWANLSMHSHGQGTVRSALGPQLFSLPGFCSTSQAPSQHASQSCPRLRALPWVLLPPKPQVHLIVLKDKKDKGDSRLSRTQVTDIPSRVLSYSCTWRLALAASTAVLDAGMSPARGTVQLTAEHH